mmetsp:Transcript_107288/g.149584  ORF Transcript_107288/g.149584 Transcript_107288/m.149584 type:complete len:145 (+) Transcript_107288:71-505(+)
MPMPNEKLQHEMERVFKPLKLVAYSNCCRYGCSGSYNETDPEFESRDQGIFFIRLHLSGMNYHEHPQECYAQYQDHDYLMKNWDEEHAILVKWCGVLGLQPGEFTISKPATEREAIRIRFAQPLNLEAQKYSDDEEEEEEDENN